MILFKVTSFRPRKIIKVQKQKQADTLKAMEATYREFSKPLEGPSLYAPLAVEL